MAIFLFFSTGQFMHHKLDNILNLAFEHHWSVVQIKQKKDTQQWSPSKQWPQQGGRRSAAGRTEMTSRDRWLWKKNKRNPLRDYAARENRLELAYV